MAFVHLNYQQAKKKKRPPDFNFTLILEKATTSRNAVFYHTNIFTVFT